MSNQITSYADMFASSARNTALAKTALAQQSEQRQMSQVQLMVMMAKRYPRDEANAMRKIEAACKRRLVVEEALYRYPRGGESIMGPSIRLAELIAQEWGNIDFGFEEIERSDTQSQFQAYAWDLERNIRRSQGFVVEYKRSSGGRVVDVGDDPRNIYEHGANMASRRLRACILAAIPRDVVKRAVEVCEETLRRIDDRPSKTKLDDMLEAYAKIGVSPSMIEDYVGNRIDAMTGAQFADLRIVYQSIRDNYSNREDYFNVGLLKPSASSGVGLAGQFAPVAMPSPGQTKSQDVAPTRQRADHSGSPDWVSAKRSLSSLVSAAGVTGDDRELFYRAVSLAHGVSALEFISVERLQDEADALRALDGKDDRFAYIWTRINEAQGAK